MNLGLRERVAIVEGSTCGIGKAVALSLANEGANVTIWGATDDIRQTSMDISRITAQSHVLPIRTNGSSKEDLKRVVLDTINRFERIDILINNMDVFSLSGAAAMSRRNDIDVDKDHIGTSEDMIHQVVPFMKQQRWGRIINLISVALDKCGNKPHLPIEIQKYTNEMASTLSTQLGTFKITVNNVISTCILTDENRSIYEHEATNKDVSLDTLLGAISKRLPMERLGAPEEVGDLVTFLSSERAGYMTGDTVLIDGGALSEGV
tara:strand:+ start:137 stop:928 length:792 start_codon:yes stop_codon:yes gene_type:complete